MRKLLVLFIATIFVLPAVAQNPKKFDGLDMNLGNLSRLSDAKTRSISPENFTGEKGKGGMATKGVAHVASSELGQGWKVSPALEIKPGETLTPIDMNTERWILLAIGFVVSFFVAWGVVAWFTGWVRRHGFTPFAIYRILLGVYVLAALT